MKLYQPIDPRQLCAGHTFLHEGKEHTADTFEPTVDETNGFVEVFLADVSSVYLDLDEPVFVRFTIYDEVWRDVATAFRIACKKHNLEVLSEEDMGPVLKGIYPAICNVIGANNGNSRTF